jgi:hypothetical protein
VKSWTHQIYSTIGDVSLPFDVETSGPANRYQSALFVEKEGFDELIQQAQIAERFDIAPMSTKGMSNTAARRLIDELSGAGVTIYVLHDFDKSGFLILHTLRTDTRRYQFQSTPKVIDLGLTLADVQAMDLQSEPVTYQHELDPKRDLARCGATAAEQAFLVQEQHWNGTKEKWYWTGQRVELNAMTSDQFVAWLERKLMEAGVQKVVPTREVLARTYRKAVRTNAINAEIERLQETMRHEPIVLPRGDLTAEVAWELQHTPAQSWECVMMQLVDDPLEPGVTSDDERCW